MVSPYKKKKLDKKGRAGELNPLKAHSGSRKQKLLKPLSSKKFYLDIKNHASLKKIEAKLISLGASLELFLVKEVDYVVTDREDFPRNKSSAPSPSPSPSPSPFCSVSPATTDSPSDGVTSKRTRSRAEAMLERVKNQPQKSTTTGDILTNAVSWQIPIYPLPKFTDWLEKLLRRAEKVTSSVSNLVGRGVRELRGNYLKVETCARPEFRQFSTWPTVPFHSDSSVNHKHHNSNDHNNQQRMTRKVGKTKDGSSSGGGTAGYCEMCRIHYDHLDNHVVSAQHLKLVTDPAQYAQLDSIINQHSLGVASNLRKSLRIAKSPPPSIEMGSKQSAEPPPISSPPSLNGHVTRSSTAKLFPLQVQVNGILSPGEKKKTDKKGSSHEDHHQPPPPSPLSPTGSDHNLRSRKLPSSTSHHPSPSPPTPVSFTPPAPSPRRARLSKKRLSVEEKLIEDNKSYYKVEVLNSKLRSTEYFISQKQLETKVNGECEPSHLMNGDAVQEEDKVEPVVVRFKKVKRKSQLSVLSDEAENFMFREPIKREVTPSEEDEETSVSNSTPEDGRKRRRTHAEALLRDNTEYYKFELPGSRLRHQNHPPLPQETKPPLELVPIKEEPLVEEEKEPTLNELKFSFGNPPTCEPWYRTYQRQDNGQEFYFPQYHMYPQKLLPFELSLLESNKLRTYSKKGYSKKKGGKLSKVQDDKPRKSPRCHASTLAILSSQIRRRPRECTTRSEPYNSILFYDEESRSSLPDTIESSSNSEVKSYIEIPDTRTLDERVSDFLLTPCFDSKCDKYSEAIRKHFSHSPNKTDFGSKVNIDFTGVCMDVDPSVVEEYSWVTSTLRPGPKIDFVTLLETYKTCTSMEKGDCEVLNFRPFESFRSSTFEGSCASSDCSDVFGFLEDGRVVTARKRKRKRNLTGWPQEKPKKKYFKKDEVPFKVIKTEPPSPVMECPEIPLEEVPEVSMATSPTQILDCPVLEDMTQEPLTPPKKRGRCIKRLSSAPTSPPLLSSPCKRRTSRHSSFTPKRYLK